MFNTNIATNCITYWLLLRHHHVIDRISIGSDKRHLLCAPRARTPSSRYLTRILAAKLTYKKTEQLVTSCSVWLISDILCHRHKFQLQKCHYFLKLKMTWHFVPAKHHINTYHDQMICVDHLQLSKWSFPRVCLTSELNWMSCLLRVFSLVWNTVVVSVARRRLNAHNSPDTVMTYNRHWLN